AAVVIAAPPNDDQPGIAVGFGLGAVIPKSKLGSVSMFALLVVDIASVHIATHTRTILTRFSITLSPFGFTSLRFTETILYSPDANDCRFLEICQQHSET